MSHFIEYKVIRGTTSECEKWLNEYKDTYKVTVVSTVNTRAKRVWAADEDIIVMVLTLERF